MPGAGGGGHGGRQKAMLDLEHTGSKAIRGVSRQHWSTTLPENVATVIHLVGEVDRRPAFRVARVQYRLVHPAPVHPSTAMPREKGGVDVHQAAPEGHDHLNRNQLQKPREDDQVDSRPMQRSQPFGTVPVIVQLDCWNSPCTRGGEGRRVAIGEDQRDLRAAEILGIAEREKVAAAARDRHCHTIAHRPPI